MVERTPYLALGIQFSQAEVPAVTGKTATFEAGDATFRLLEGFLPDLPRSMEALSLRDRQTLLEHFGRGPFDALLALAREKNPGYFFQGLLELGKGLVDSGRVAAAWKIFQYLETKAPHPEIAEQALGARNELEGRGGFGSRAESFLRAFSKEVSDFRAVGPALAGAFFGSLFYNLGRFKVSRRLYQSLQAQAEIYPSDILRLRFWSRVLPLVGGAAGSMVVEQGLRSLLGEQGLWSRENLMGAYQNSLVNLFAWRFSRISNDLPIASLGPRVAIGSSRRIVFLGPRPTFRRRLEVFLLTQTAATMSLALAMHVSPPEGVQSQQETLARLFTTLLGMNLGRLAGRKLGG